MTLPLTTPPTGLPWSLNRASPQARGLGLWLTPLAGSDGVAFDQAAPHVRSIQTGMPLDARALHGRAWSLGDDGDQFALSPTYGLKAGQDFTMTWWGQVDAWPGGGKNAGMWRTGASATGLTFIIWFLTSARPWIYWGGSEIFLPGSGGLPALGVPYHLAWVIRSAATVEFYINGRLDSSATHSNATPAESIYYLGWQFNTSERFSGQWSDTRFYNRALSAAEVWHLYAPQTRWDLYDVPMGIGAADVAPPNGLMLRGVGT